MANETRYLTSWDFAITGNLNDLIASFPFELRERDSHLHCYFVLNSGSIGIQLDGDPADRAVIAANGPTDIDISNDVTGYRTLNIYARSTPTNLAFGEITAMR